VSSVDIHVPLNATARSFMWIVRAADAGLKDTLGRLHGIVAGIDAEDLHNHDHSDNVARYSVAVGRALGFDADHLAKLQRAAFLHDIGKAGVATSILAKRGPLTAAETELMQGHPASGADILAAAGLHEESRWVRAHHERADGRGYPDGLVGDEIPLEARILLVADSFEAMTSDRPYRRGMSVADALDELRRCAGPQFDPLVVAAFAGLIEGGLMQVRAVREPTGPAAPPPNPMRRAGAGRRRGHVGDRCQPVVGARVGRAPPDH
jgi:HD-GYP domain-containing protein (c-di-GMP phosphodiesterase class II)